MDADFRFEEEEKGTGGVSRETSLFWLIAALVVSCATHVLLMYACSDCAFAPLRGDLADTRRWTKELPVMQVRKMDGDPFLLEKAERPRPAAAPDNERQEARVARLSSAERSAVAPEMPVAAVAATLAEPAPESAQAASAEWMPRQEIVAIEAPTVPDDLAALPRLVVPKVARVKGAADITPAYDLMAAPKLASDLGGGGGGPRAASLAAAADAAAEAAPAPLPPALADARRLSALSGSFGAVKEPSAARELSAAERARAEDRAEKAAARLAAEKAPTPPAPTSMLVDEKAVARRREAVRALRDDTTAQGRAFGAHVALALGAWIDPEQPARKYFRVVVSSRAEQPLPVVSKDMVFLMDASGSIANDRLRACRKAVSAALRLLNTGDRFNVVAFRDKFSFAFPQTAWRDVSKEAFEEADDWMARLTAHGQTDVFRTLRGVLAMPRDPSRPVVALVITDGEATSGLTRSAEIISRFSALNGGLISIFMYGVKGNANAYLMDMLTRGNRGTWARHEGLRWSAADGIPALARKFQRPVLADISVLFSASSRAETYPQLVPNLCEDAPIEIYGSCPADQDELVFSLRGLNGALVFENMFRLSFAQAKKMGPEVRTAWAQRRLYALVAAYTARPEARLLQDLRRFAETYKIQIPYEREMR